MDKNKSLENKKNTGIVVALGVAIVVGIVVLVIAIVSMSSADKTKNDKSDNKGSTEYTLAPTTGQTFASSSDNAVLEYSAQNSDVDDSVYTVTKNNSGVSDTFGNDSVQAGDVVTVSTTVKNTVGYDPIAEYKTHTNNGDNILSDYHENEYIKLVADKYKVDTDLLVAIYSDPDVGSNFVLEFNGKKDSDGKYIKSPDTLEKVYQIDKDKNISVATGKPTGNIGVSYAEGTLCFYMVKTVVMKQYPDYFTGV